MSLPCTYLLYQHRKPLLCSVAFLCIYKLVYFTWVNYSHKYIALFHINKMWLFELCILYYILLTSCQTSACCYCCTVPCFCVRCVSTHLGSGICCLPFELTRSSWHIPIKELLLSGVNGRTLAISSPASRHVLRSPKWPLPATNVRWAPPNKKQKRPIPHSLHLSRI